MKPSAREIKEFHDLMGRIREAEINAEQEMRLEVLLRSYPQFQQDYVDYLLLCEALHSYQSLVVEDYQDRPTQRIWDEAFWRAMADYETKAPSVPMEKSEEKALSEPHQPERFVQEIKRTPLIVAMTALFILVFLLVFLQAPHEETVAVLRDSMKAAWSNDSPAMEIGGEFINTDATRSLESGMLAIHMYCGASVLIEGPARFSLPQEDRVVVYSGRIYAKVPHEVMGFTVDTPNARVVDLGTEFGIDVDQNGISQVHMLKGKASLKPEIQGQQDQLRLIKADQALEVNSTSGVRDIPLQRQLFVREISSKQGWTWRGEPINLADILGGGDGFGTVLKTVNVDPASGVITPEDLHNAGKRPGQKGYFLLPSLFGVDGVFVPDYEQGQLVVSSAGNIFRECPKTSFNCWTYITNQPRLLSQQVSGYSNRLGHLVFDRPEMPAIFMHANAGLTFDLNAIRTRWPQFQLSSFTASCGIVQGEDCGNHAAFLVLLDGQKRAEFHAISDGLGRTGDISVSLTETDRFLTLLTLDDGDDVDHDWTLFGLPFLKVEERLANDN